MRFSQDEIVTLKSTRGGWDGVISEPPSVGPQGPEYVVYPLDFYRDDRHVVIVREDDIEPASGNFDYPSWSLNQSVTLYQNTGTIVSIDGNFLTVEVDHVVNKDLTVTRTHTVRRWRLLIENK